VSNAIWGIHAGGPGEADKLFLGGNVIALCWEQFGDLSSLVTQTNSKIQVCAIVPGRVRAWRSGLAALAMALIRQAGREHWISMLPQSSAAGATGFQSMKDDEDST
jgi:hypothetical protein